jgi:hypothetical protein
MSDTTKLEALRKAELEALAEEHGVDASGTKADIIERLVAADVEAPEAAIEAIICAWCGKDAYDGDPDKTKAALKPGEDVSAPACIHCGHNPR